MTTSPTTTLTADSGARGAADAVSGMATPLEDLSSRVSAARVLVPINNWEFAERVWAGLRPHLRTRLWVLEALLAREPLANADDGSGLSSLARLASEIHQVESEVDEVLNHRSSLSEFSSLLEERLSPCLGKLEQLQEALHERHAV